MREYRSEFSPEHGVWILKRVECETREEAETGRTVPVHSPRLRLVEPEPAART